MATSGQDDVPEPTSTFTVAPFFGKLPREIRDDIYGYAFCEGDSVVKLIKYQDWYHRETTRRAPEAGSSHWSSSPSPPTRALPAVSASTPANGVLPFHGMIVNKQFFNEAATAWMRLKTIDLGSIPRGSPMPTTIQKAKVDWNGRFLSTPSKFNDLAKLPMLEKLEILIGADLMESMRGYKLLWRDDLTELEFSTNRDVQALTKSKSLISVQLVPAENRFVESLEEKAQWEKNVAAFQEYIQQEVVKHKTDAAGDAAEVEDGELEDGYGDENYWGRDRIEYCGNCLEPVEIPACSHACPKPANTGTIVACIAVVVALIALIVVGWMFAELRALRAIVAAK